MNNVWTVEVEDICEKLRINCVNLAEYHRKRYYQFKSYGKYFRIPAIILASITSTASIGLQPLLDQNIISGITCILGMTMGILSAIEIYMGIQTSMELELKQSKEFYTLAIDLYKTLTLQSQNRSEDGKDYLNTKYGQYIKMVEASNLLKRSLKVDLLTSIPKKYKDYAKPGTPPLTPSQSNICDCQFEIPNIKEQIDETMALVSNPDLFDIPFNDNNVDIINNVDNIENV
jgi:hypothetical protein